MGKEPAGIAHGSPPPPNASALVARLLPSCFHAAGSWSSFLVVMSWCLCLWQWWHWFFSGSGSGTYFSVGFGSGPGSCFGSCIHCFTNFIFVFLPCKRVRLLIVWRGISSLVEYFFDKKEIILNWAFLLRNCQIFTGVSEQFYFKFSSVPELLGSGSGMISPGSGSCRKFRVLNTAVQIYTIFYFLRRLRLLSTKLLKLFLRGCVILPGILGSFLWYGLGNLIYLFASKKVTKCCMLCRRDILKKQCYKMIFYGRVIIKSTSCCEIMVFELIYWLFYFVTEKMSAGNKLYGTNKLIPLSTY
jgi:hypothetical protein